MPNVQSNNSNEICAFFKNRSDALAAIADLKDAGFTSDQIGLAMADDPSLTSSEPLRTEGVGGPVDTAACISFSWQHRRPERMGQDQRFLYRRTRNLYWR